MKRLVLCLAFLLPTSVAWAQDCPPDAGRKRVIYDNDAIDDTYTHDYMMALAHNCEIELLEIIQTGPDYIGPPDPTASYTMQNVQAARDSGLLRIPNPSSGVSGEEGGPDHILRRPAGDVIANTTWYDAPATTNIYQQVLKAQAGGYKIYYVTGGPPSTLVAAWFKYGNVIRNHIVWVANCGTSGAMQHYNCAVDPWASYVALRTFGTAAGQADNSLFFDWRENGTADVPRWRMEELPDSPLRSFMLNKNHPMLVEGKDADGNPAFWLMRPDVITNQWNVRFSHWAQHGLGFDGDIPWYARDSAGPATVVDDHDTAIMTAEFWRALTKAFASIGSAAPRPPGNVRILSP